MFLASILERGLRIMQFFFFLFVANKREGEVTIIEKFVDISNFERLQESLLFFLSSILVRGLTKVQLFCYGLYQTRGKVRATISDKFVDIRNFEQ